MIKTVAITGASGTLGRAVAERFTAAEWRVAAGDSSIDVTCETTQKIWFRELGRVDALVTCAGISLVKPSLELSAKEWRRVIDVNLTGSFLAAREAIRSGCRRVVFVGSIHGCAGTSYPERAAYTASKAGVTGLTQALAVEFAPKGVAVNCVAPGHLPVLMDGTGAGQALLNAATERTPTGRLATPEEVAGVIFWLCDAAPLSLTGQTIIIDGGFTLTTYPL